MKVPISGSWWAVASASSLIFAQTGSSFCTASFGLDCLCAMVASGPPRNDLGAPSLAQLGYGHPKRNVVDGISLQFRGLRRHFQLTEKALDGVGELIVAVAGHHMAG